MRHYDRADLRHLNDSERYRDYDYVADDGWPPAPEPLSMREQPPQPEPRAVAAPAPSPSMWRLLLTALGRPVEKLRKAVSRRSR